jgi:ankyrin repeat protein
MPSRSVTIFCVSLSFTCLFASACWAQTNDVSEDFYRTIRENDLPHLQALVAKGADVNVKDSRGETPLMYSAAVGSLTSMRFLIDKGADVNVQNQFGSTALIWSVTDLAKVRLLLDHGANPNLASKRGRTPLLVAAMSDSSAAIVRLLLAKGADVNAKDFLKTTAVRAAALGNDTETIRLLIDAGVDVNAVDLPGISPLMMAAGWNGNVDAVKLLLAKGANVNAVSKPVMGLPSKNGPSKFGNLTALLMSTPFGPPELIQTLLDAGASVNAQDVRGMTPLLLAVATDHQNPAVIKMLLDKGADPQIKDAAGETAQDWARKIGLPQGMELLHAQPATDAANAVPTVAQGDLRPTVTRTVSLVEKSAAKFFAASGCVSCHAQSMTDLVVAEAGAKGVPIDASAAADRVQMLKAVYPPEPFYERFDAAGAQEQVAYPLIGLAALHHPPDRMTDAMAANIAAAQLANGSWHVGAATRPPAEEGDLFRAAICIRALKVYAPPGRGPEMQLRIERARQWLASATPITAEDRNMQILGLHWAGADARKLTPLVKVVLAKQQPQGGWSQREGQKADSYATGQSLFMLAVAGGVSPADPAYQRGLKFLLSTQAADGSWYVPSRSPKVQAYFDGGFPYSGDQWISSWGTAWAAMALAQALDTPVQSAGLAGK